MKEKIKSFAKMVWGQITLTPLRRAFFYSFMAGLVFLLLGLTTGFAYLNIVAFACFIVAIGASMISLGKKRREFNAEVDKRKMEIIRNSGKDISLMPAAQLKGLSVFSSQERMFIQRKRREFKGNMIIRVMLIAFLIFMIFTFFSGGGAGY